MYHNRRNRYRIFKPFDTEVSLMHTRYIATREDVKRFMLTNRPEGNKGGLKSKFVKSAVAVVLVTGIAAATSAVLYNRKAPMTIEINGSDLPSQNGFCAVKCRNSNVFYSADIVYVDNLSVGEKYRKKIYDRNERLLVEGIGNDSERWFLNPDYKGEPHLAKAIKVGKAWQTMAYYKGEEALKKWNEIQTRY